MSYTQLTERQRYQMSTLLNSGFSKTYIAKQLNVYPSTMTREIKRNSGLRGYRPKQANEQALARRHGSRKNQRFTDELQAIIRKYLEQKWSPEQITGYLKSTGGNWVSHERIYQFIKDDQLSGGTLYKHLRHSSKKRKKRYGAPDRRGEIKNRVSIDKRPKIVEKRERLGDWELDTMIGKSHKGALVTIVDRCSLKTLIKKVPSKHAPIVTAACIEKLAPYAAISTTATVDNGKEFAGHQEIAKALGIDVYFAHPYSSWERGTNENTNGLIRQYIPKGSSFDKYDDEYIAFVEDQLNNRPRKCLDYLTPNQYFDRIME